MSKPSKPAISRRAFVRRSGLAAGAVLVGSSAPPAPAADRNAVALPTKVLGKTNVPVTTITLGTAPCGLCPKISPKQIAEIVDEAVERGITSIDTAPAYKQSEEGIGLALGRRRKEVFLATKVLADTIEDAEKSLNESFKLLKTDHLDLVYYHSIGSRKLEGTMEPGGVFHWLLEQKKAGKFRFLGISGHKKPGRFAQFLETGQVDVLLAVINFVDRHTYNVEQDVLPIAQKNNVGIVAMKVFGGARRKSGGYRNPDAPPQMDVADLDSAVRYALGTPGVATLNLGVHNKKQLVENIEMVRRFEPLTADEQTALLATGKQLAADWGPHFGPVEEEEAKA